MNRRSLLVTIGAAALGFVLLLGVALRTVPGAVAQGETPGDEATRQMIDEARVQAYDDFVASLAAELGVDAAAVDAAVRTTLRERVDAQEAAGELSTEEAAARRAVIEVSEAPLPLGFGGRGYHGGDGRFGGRGGDDDRTDSDELPASDDVVAEATPTI